MLALWREKVATEIIAEVETASTAESRFDMLWKAAMKPAPELFGGRKIETAMRAWALADSQVGDALAVIAKQRRDFIARLLRDMGLADPHLPDLLYAAYIGLDDLSSRGRVEMEEAFKTMRGLLSRNLD